LWPSNTTDRFTTNDFFTTPPPRFRCRGCRKEG
jgi:hypothetical protein